MRPQLDRLSSPTTGYWDPYFLVHRRLFKALTYAAKFAQGDLLDIGCGNKPYETLFRPWVRTYVGCDIAQSSLHRVDIICDATAVPLADESVDTVLSTQAIEHVSDHRALLAEASRVLRANGILILSAPMYWCLHEEPYDFFRFTAHGLRHLLALAGFQIMDLQPNGGCWSVTGLALIHAVQTTRLQSRSLLWLINWLFSKLDDRNQSPLNTSNYVVVAQKASVQNSQRQGDVLFGQPGLSVVGREMDEPAMLQTPIGQGKVSVVIPCYNDGPMLREALASIEEVRNPNLLEVIIVDDGSSEAQTTGILREVAEAGYCVVSQPNRGLGAARNAGIRLAKGEFILPLDSDNRLRGVYLNEGVSVLKNNPNVGVIYADAEYFGEKSGRWHVPEFNLLSLIGENFIDACALFRKRLWEEIGGYDERMPRMGLEDWDFWLRVASHGGSFAHLPKIGFDYRVRRDSLIAKARPHGGEIANYIFGKLEMACYKLLRELDQEVHNLSSRIRAIEDSRTYRLGRALLAPTRLLRRVWHYFHRE
jgi:glycosyltransferase involved in cell wall biosynthesis/SAM-dependent methyltransferase